MRESAGADIWTAACECVEIAAAAVEDENFQTTSIDSNAGQWHSVGWKLYAYTSTAAIDRALRHGRAHTHNLRRHFFFHYYYYYRRHPLQDAPIEHSIPNSVRVHACGAPGDNDNTTIVTSVFVTRQLAKGERRARFVVTADGRA